tara:strand:+ start:189 stop:353 length:165 start_codon:yes stop_codon:yes gene_type:complete
MSYYESAEGQTITRERAIQVINQHHCGEYLKDFFAEVGDRDTYKATDVLDWLNY